MSAAPDHTTIVAQLLDRMIDQAKRAKLEEGERRLSVDDLPIPPDAKVGLGWTALMRELAGHIGAYRTLLLVQHFGGRQVYVRHDPEQLAVRHVVGPEAARIISHVYAGELLELPNARLALDHCRRGIVLAACRQGLINTSETAHILRLVRKSVSRLLNHDGEGRGIALPPSLRRRLGDPRQIDMFPEPDSPTL